MRLTTVILIASLMQVSAATFGQRITLNKTNAPLSGVLKEIRKQSGFDFYYDDKTIPESQKINISVTNATLNEALNIAFKGLKLKYEIEGTIVSISKDEPSLLDKLSSAVSNIMRDLTVKGRVTDEQGKPLPNASIRVKGKNAVTNTDENGMFEIKAVAEDAVLQVSYVGYKTLEIPVKGAVMPLEIKLNLATGELEEVKVEYSTGYQQLNKERATGSFAYIDNKLFNRSVGANVLDRILNVTSGLLLTQVQNATKNSLGIQIRGVSTINANQTPLVVVDNFIYEGNVNDLNPNDVESVTVLKDAAAASIWGVRAGNGVIVITTKKGKLSQSTSIGFNTNLTIGQKPDLSYIPSIPSKDIVAFEKQRFADSLYNDYDDVYPSYPYLPAIPMVAEILLAARRAGIADPLSDLGVKAQLALYENHDVRDDIKKYMLQNSISQQYALNVSGGGSNYRYYSSVGYDKSKPNDIGKTSDRLTLRFNNLWTPLRNLDLIAKIVWGQSNEKSTSKIDLNTILQSPYTRLVDESGGPAAIPYQYRLNYVDTVNAPSLLDWHFRPLDEMKNGNNLLNSNNITINTGIAYIIVPGLKASINYQWQKTDSEHKEIERTSLFSTRDLINQFLRVDPLTGLPIYPYPLGSILNSGYNSNTSWNFRGQLNYNQHWKKHDLMVLTGWEVRQNSSYNTTNVPLFGFIEDTNIGQLPLYGDWITRPSGSQQIIAPSINSPFEFLNRFGSYFANGGYSYDNKYVINLSARLDQSNFFGVKANDRKVPLWSAGIIWDISKEVFYKIDFLPQLKIRVTYGYNGNTNSGTTPFAISKYRSSDLGSNIILAPFSNLISPPNPQLRWERVKNVNVALDFGLKNARVTGSIELYQKKGLDLISGISVDPTSGFSTYTGNNASIKGKGIDFTLNSRNIDGQRFRWNSSFLWNINKENVISYNVKPPTSYGFYVYGDAIVVGKPLSSLYSLHWAGLDPSNGDARLFINGEVKESAEIDNVQPVDLVYHGRTSPTIFGSFRNDFSWNNFSLSVNVIYKMGYYFRRGSFNGDLTSNSSFPHKDYLNAWKKTGDEMFTNVPGYMELYPDNRFRVYQFSDILIEKGDHVRLQDIRISYGLSKRGSKRRPFDNAQIYFYANNLGILWRANNKGIDPEAYASLATPTPSTFSLGLNFTF
ncbi:SusC/RagA family TonB-linked outer membrane protein [Pedobacter africanus]|uniref:SusC/RagA family TonB-linked outer membrane protein n=1 Tax=Pedobacter africanus TaxID=151894 RepID=UPI003391322C